MDKYCSICNKECKDTTATFVCRHYFCQGCIVSWYRSSISYYNSQPSCPICKLVDHIWGK